MGRACKMLGEMCMYYLVGKSERRKPLRKPRHRCGNNTIWGLDASGSGQRPVAGSCLHFNEPSGSIKSREFLD